MKKHIQMPTKKKSSLKKVRSSLNLLVGSVKKLYKKSALLIGFVKPALFVWMPMPPKMYCLFYLQAVAIINAIKNPSVFPTKVLFPPGQENTVLPCSGVNLPFFAILKHFFNPD